jgi:hypothetical protein
MILSDLLGEIREPAETLSEKQRRYEAEHTELNRALLAYTRAQANRELRKTEQAKVEAEAEQIGDVGISDEEAAARLTTLETLRKGL